MLCVTENHLVDTGSELYNSIRHLRLPSVCCSTYHTNGGYAIYTNHRLGYAPIDRKEFCQELDIELAGIVAPIVVVAVCRSPDDSLYSLTPMLDMAL